MRVLLDANVVIRMLLRSPNTSRAVDVILEAGLRRVVSFLVPVELRREVLAKVEDKPFLARRIHREEAVAFLTDLAKSGEILPIQFGPARPLSRDPKDDYLLAYADSGRADFLVTDDEDLLVLDGQFPFRILRPPDFLTVLREHGHL